MGLVRETAWSPKPYDHKKILNKAGKTMKAHVHVELFNLCVCVRAQMRLWEEEHPDGVLWLAIQHTYEPCKKKFLRV